MTPMLVSAAVVALSFVSSPARVQELRTFTPAEMQEDLFQLTEKLTSLHSGLYRYASKEEIEDAFAAASLATEEKARDVVWFYRRVSELLARIRCGHTIAQLGERDEQAALARRGMLPFQVLLAGSRMWITRVLDENCGLSPGQELLAIDGLDVATIRERAFACLSDDGFIETAKERGLEQQFARLFVLLVAERESGPYDVLTAGAAAPVQVAGITPARYAEKHRDPPRSRQLALTMLPGGVAVLDFDAFGDAGSGPKFPEQLETIFRRLRDEKVPHLVLDLRGNGGGRDMYGAGLVSYLGSKPFQYFERIEVTPDYAGKVRIEERDGRRLMLSHPGLDLQQPAELHFQGDVCILIDGFTFSTAADVATVAHVNHLATFFGEETGGGYEGNNSGDNETLRLSNSSILTSIQEWNYTTAGVGPGHHGRGVVPDVEVRATIEDVLAGRDVVLERAAEHMRSGAKR